MVTFATAPVSRIREQPHQRAIPVSLQEQRARTLLPGQLVSAHRMMLAISGHSALLHPRQMDKFWWWFLFSFNKKKIHEDI